MNVCISSAVHAREQLSNAVGDSLINLLNASIIYLWVCKSDLLVLNNKK